MLNSIDNKCNVSSWSALESYLRALHTDYYHSFTNYITKNSQPRLIITDCFHLGLITLLVSGNLILVHSFTHGDILYVVTLHS